jgi:hypothetical protein
MTCTPPGTNWKRLIVAFDQIAPVYKAPTLVDRSTQDTTSPKELPKSDTNIFLDWIAEVFSI